MPEFLLRLFDTSDFPPRWHCGQWTAGHGYLHIVSDVAISLAYLGIPLAIAWFVSRRRDMPFPRILWLFSLFILFCGATHLVEAGIFWVPAYRLLGLLKMCTAVVSVMTLFATIAILPQALRLRTPAELEREVASRTAALEESRATLDVRNEQMKSLLRSVSHDLKAPVVTVRGFAAAMREDLDAGDLDAARESLGRIARAGERMSSMVDDLLALNSVGSGDVAKAPLDLRAEVQSSIDALSPLLVEKSATVSVDSTLPASVYAAADELQRVLDNLLTNALKYGCTATGAVIEVGGAIDESGGAVTLWVRDHGPGVADRDKERIFQVFERASTASTGTGLGLAIVRRIAENHGGRAWIEDADPGARIAVSFRSPPS